MEAGMEAVIVLAGTALALVLAFSVGDLVRALKAVPEAYFGRQPALEPLVAELVELATVVRKDGVLALESRRANMSDAMLKRGVQFVLDGLEPAAVREVLAAEVASSRLAGVKLAQVWEWASALAVLVGFGLGHAAWGVGLAVVLFLPWAIRLRRRAAAEARVRELVMTGVLGIQEAMNPGFLREKLSVF